MILQRTNPFARVAQRVGFVPLAQVSPAAPHYNDAMDLDKMLQAMDHKLRVGFIYDPHDRKLDRWGVMRFTDDGGQQLVRIVQHEDRSYHPPDQRVFLDLQKHKLDGPNGRFWIKQALEQDERIAAAKEKLAEEDRKEFVENVIKKHVRDIRFKGKQGQKNF